MLLPRYLPLHCCLGAAVALAVILCTALAGADDQGNSLARANIKFKRGPEGEIVAVELPRGARDLHIEVIVEIPTI